MELAPVYDLSAVNQRHFRHFQFLVQRDIWLADNHPEPILENQSKEIIEFDVFLLD